MRKHTIFATSLLAMLAFTHGPGAMAAIDPDQSGVPAPAGDGWQLLGAGPASASVVAATPSIAAAAALPPAAPLTALTDVKTVVLPGAATADPAGTLTFSITPQDVNLRNALDRWLQTQGWQLAWKIDDDLPVEFNATFTGDFRSVLTQVMEATNHMRTPARICKHTNNVIRVIARAANCKD